MTITVDDSQVAQMEAELDEVNQEIKDLVERKIKIEQEIAMKKIYMVLSQSTMESQLQNSLESQYKQYSELAIQEKIKYQNLDYEINALQKSLNAKING